MDEALHVQEPQEVNKPRWCMKWVFQGFVVGLVATMVVIIYDLGTGRFAIGPTGQASTSTTKASTCPPKPWILETFGNGHWIINNTDPVSWAWYLEFLNVSKDAYDAEFHATDMHQYIFWTNASGMFYIMNHTIPSSGFHLLFEADANGVWRKNPYPVLTPAGFDPSSAKVDLQKVRYVIEEPGIPFADSCWSWRTDMPMVVNRTENGKVTPTEFVVSFWRELTSPTDMRCTLYIVKGDTYESIAPWSEAGYGLTPSDAIPGAPKRLSYRYFKKTTQSFADAEKRLSCEKSGIAGDHHKFC
jgi:hypothetical protein